MPRAASNGTAPPPTDIRAFADELAHEIRTPLAQIRLVVETMLAGRIASESDREQALESIDREAERLGELTESLLLLLRSGEPDPYPVRRRLDLGTLLEDALAGRGSARSLLVDPPAGLFVAADPSALRLALVSLADEALVRAGGGHPTVAVHADGDDVVVEFGPTRPDPAGDATGAGRRSGGFRIVVAEQIVRAHGGALTSGPDGGSIGVRLPLAPALADAAGAGAAGVPFDPGSPSR